MRFIVLADSFLVHAFLHETAKLVHDSVHHDYANYQHPKMNFSRFRSALAKRASIKRYLVN